MNAEAYTLLVLAARYWFVALMLLIAGQCAYVGYRQFLVGQYIARSISRLGTDTTAALFLLSDADGRVPAGTRFPLQAESVLGSSPRCDIALPKGSAAKRCATILTQEDRVLLRPIGNAPIAVNGEMIASETELHAGDAVQIGGFLFKLGKEVLEP